MEAHSDEVRELVLGAYEEGLKTKPIAEKFKVGRAWVRGVKRRWREHRVRTVIEQKHGPDPLLGPEDRKMLAKLVEDTPDATLEELRKQLKTPVSTTTIWRALKQMKLTLKKSRCTPASRSDRT